MYVRRESISGLTRVHNDLGYIHEVDGLLCSAKLMVSRLGLSSIHDP